MFHMCTLNSSSSVVKVKGALGRECRGSRLSELSSEIGVDSGRAGDDNDNTTQAGDDNDKSDTNATDVADLDFVSI